MEAVYSMISSKARLAVIEDVTFRVARRLKKLGFTDISPKNIPLNCKLMMTFGLSRRDYLMILDEIDEDLFFQNNPHLVKKAKSEFPKRWFGWKNYTLDIPDLSLSEIYEIACVGYWPLEYFKLK